MVMRVLFTAALFFAVWPAPANAQIYAWRDANGTLVVSDRVIDQPTDVYQVEGAPRYVSTTPVAAESTSARELYEPYVLDYSNRHSLRPELVRAVIQVESGFNPSAHSPKGAMGLMQLMPATARHFGVQNAYNPEENVRAGVAYLKSLLTRFNDDVSLALAAYNAGPKAVEKYGNTVPPYKETRNYVSRIRANSGPTAPVHTGPAPIVRTVQIVDGREVIKYVQKQ